MPDASSTPRLKVDIKLVNKLLKAGTDVNVHPSIVGLCGSRSAADVIDKVGVKD